MKRFSCFLIFGLFVTGALFAQEQESAQMPTKLLFEDENGEFWVLFEQKTQDDSRLRRIKISQVSLVSRTYDLFAMTKVTLSIRKKTGKPGGPGNAYWETQEMVALTYVSKADTEDRRFEFMVFAGPNAAAIIKEIYGELPDSLKAINNRLLFAKDVPHQIKDEKKFLEVVEPALVFAKEIIEEAEKFDEKKGLPEKLIQQIPEYLDFDPAAWGLAPIQQEEEKK